MLRLERKVSLNDVVKQMDKPVRTTTLNNWENGLGVPNGYAIDSLSTIYGVTADYLMGRSEHPNRYATMTNDYPSFTELSRAYRALSHSYKPRRLRELEIQLSDYYSSDKLEQSISLKNIDEKYRSPKITNTVFIYGSITSKPEIKLSDVPCATREVHHLLPIHDFALYVDTNMFFPFALEKELLYFRESKHLYNGDIALFEFDGKTYLYKYINRYKDNKIELVSLHDSSLNRYLDTSSLVTVKGRLICR